MNMPCAFSQAHTYLTTISAPYAGCEAARIELRALGQECGGRRPIKQSWHSFADVERAAAHSLDLASRGWDVYAGVLPRREGGGAAEDLRACGYLWCDIDGGNAGPEAALALLSTAWKAKRIFHPHLLVCSGGGIHAYWRLPQPVACRNVAQQKDVGQYLRRIVLAIGGSSEPNGAFADVASTDAARILRVAGTVNHKPEYLRPSVRILLNRTDVPPQTLAHWGARLPAEPDYEAHRRTSTSTYFNYRASGTLPPTILRRLTVGVPHGHIHTEAKKTAAYFRKEGCGESEIRSYIEQVFLASGVDVSKNVEARKLDHMARWSVIHLQPVEPVERVPHERRRP